MESTKQPFNKKLIIVIVSLLVVIGAVLAVIFLRPEETEILDDDTPKIGYAIDGVTAVDADVPEGNIALEYKNDAFSENGKTFSCYIANASSNSYDMYIQMFSDKEFTDQLLLSGLLRPGTAFDTITLEHELDPGKHTVYVIFTQVEDDMQTIHGQVTVTMDLNVS